MMLHSSLKINQDEVSYKATTTQ